jgi:threonine/homoserine/homoserine lactone efflux protein
MHTTLSLNSMAALFVAMMVLAAIPGVSVLAVTARSASAGFAHGVLTTAGIVVGDIIFIIIAILGLSLLAATLGDLFILVKYIGGAYLIWLGIKLWRIQSSRGRAAGNTQNSPSSSFLTGLFITLGDQKAILFYLGFYPAFVDLAALTLLDSCIIIIIATIAVGSVKLVYAYIASSAVQLTGSQPYRAINIIAGSVLFTVGLFLIVMP